MRVARRPAGIEACSWVAVTIFAGLSPWGAPQRRCDEKLLAEEVAPPRAVNDSDVAECRRPPVGPGDGLCAEATAPAGTRRVAAASARAEWLLVPRLHPSRAGRHRTQPLVCRPPIRRRPSRGGGFRRSICRFPTEATRFPPACTSEAPRPTRRAPTSTALKRWDCAPSPRMRSSPVCSKTSTSPAQRCRC